MSTFLSKNVDEIFWTLSPYLEKRIIPSYGGQSAATGGAGSG
jgi:hypothetical protein